MNVTLLLIIISKCALWKEKKPTHFHINIRTKPGVSRHYVPFAVSQHEVSEMKGEQRRCFGGMSEETLPGITKH